MSECLDKFILFGKTHLDYQLQEYTEYYNHHRSHSARENLLPVREEPKEVVSLKLSEVKPKNILVGW